MPTGPLGGGGGVTHREAVHEVEADLHRRGWLVYRSVFDEGADLVAARDWHPTPLLVAVKRPIIAKGRAYPRLERMGLAPVLASVNGPGSIEYLDIHGNAVLMDGTGLPGLLSSGNGGAAAL
jgi:hypothetical protein